eukprot:8642918-Alexandrium_andersonii.AAC.1
MATAAPRTPGASSGSSQGPGASPTTRAPRVRGLSDRKASQTFEKLSALQRSQDLSKAEQDILTSIRGDEKLMTLVRGVINKYTARKERETKLRR